MAQVKPDRRTERTHQALLDAFVALLFERGYDAINVAEIIERANIGRSTFYEHYAGKEALLRETIGRRFSTLAGLVDGTVSAVQIVGLLDHFIEHGKLSRTLLNGPTRPLMVRCLAELIEPMLGRPDGGTTPLLPRAMVAAQVAEAQLALIGQWLASRACSAEAMADAVIAVTGATLAALLRRTGVTVP